MTGLHITGNEAESSGDIGRLVDTVLRFTQGPDPALSRQAVMSVLLSHPEPFQLLGIYVERELAIKMEEIESDPGIVEAAQQKRFWGSAFIYCLESKKVMHRFPRQRPLDRNPRLARHSPHLAGHRHPVNSGADPPPSHPRVPL